ncbi:MAG: extracellular solute-binding protein [Haliea sp.]|nr:extracellular solute-binding protein [Haliea sp.]
MARLWLIAICLLAIGQMGRAEQAVLNIYNWADYIDPTVLEEFEQEYGIRINYDTYDSSSLVDTKLLAGNSGYDIVFHSAGLSARLIPIDVYHRVDYSRLENWHHIDTALVGKIESSYGQPVTGVPYMWGTTGFSYNVKLLRERMPDAPVHSSALIFDPEIVSRFADCGVSLLDDSTTVIGTALLYLGYPANSIEPQHLREVEELLRDVRPYIRYFSNAKMLLDLPSEEVCIAMSWSGDYSVARSRAVEAGLDIELAYSVPEEGITNWFDMMYIPADAPNLDGAYLFLDFILRPDVIARITDFTGYANANVAATALIDPQISGDLAIYPDETIIERLHSVNILPPKLERIRSRSWTKIKTGL